MMLDENTFIDVIHNTPLISIDIILSRDDGRILLGRRTNAPARGFWFVPGGRIYKNETLECAFCRISCAELGHQYTLRNATLQGCYEHFYQENFAGVAGVSTHYVVLAYTLKMHNALKNLPAKLPDTQHDLYQWFSIAEIKNNKEVHTNTRAYFLD